MIERQIDVALGERSYPIYFGQSMVSSFASTCQQHGIPRRVVIITDTNVAPHYLSSLEINLRTSQFNVSSITVPPGENQKSLHRSNAIYTILLKQAVSRRSAIVALGGGVIGDLAGFVAATYQRGIELVQVPTTLLAQVDSSVGGKVAVNHPLGKNMIGAFHQPRFVWVDAATLATLPKREILCGLGEVVKYGVVFDEEFFAYLELNLPKVLNLDAEAITHVQVRCCELKAHVVSEDEREQGMRIVLNFGHTIGHALEVAGRYRALKHGEAVLLGMLAESHIAREMGLLSPEVFERISRIVQTIPFKFSKSVFISGKILNTIGRDKKSIDGKTRFVLPIRLGEVQVVEEVDEKLIKASLAFVVRTVGKNSLHTD